MAHLHFPPNLHFDPSNLVFHSSHSTTHSSIQPLHPGQLVADQQTSPSYPTSTPENQVQFQTYQHQYFPRYDGYPPQHYYPQNPSLPTVPVNYPQPPQTSPYPYHQQEVPPCPPGYKLIPPSPRHPQWRTVPITKQCEKKCECGCGCEEKRKYVNIADFTCKDPEEERLKKEKKEKKEKEKEAREEGTWVITTGNERTWVKVYTY